MRVLTASIIGAAYMASLAQSPTTIPSQAAGQTTQPQSAVNPNAVQETPAASQNPPAQDGQQTGSAAPAVTNPLPALPIGIWDKRGVMVEAVRFEGVTFRESNPLLAELTQKAGQPLDPDKVRTDLRRLFASGRYRDISVSGAPTGNGLTLIYSGIPRYYVGRVAIDGVGQERLASLLQFATKLDPGTPFSEPELATALEGVHQSLEQNGYYQADVKVATTQDNAGHQINITFTINQGPQARVGNVKLQGKDPGIMVPEFRKKGKLDCSWFAADLNKMILHSCQVKVTRETTSNALSGVRRYYQKREHLEGTISSQSQTYAKPRQQLDYDFEANQGPIVHVVIEGTKISGERKKLLVPVYEEGAVDRDLVNEGAFNIRDYLQRKGYFDASDSVKLLGRDTNNVTVQYKVDPGQRHKVRTVKIEGNKYFSDDLIEERLRVKKADLYLRSGTYSTQLVENDRSAIEALYRGSGFTKVKVASSVKDIQKSVSGQPLKEGLIDVTYKIEEGPQQKFGMVNLSGADAAREEAIKALLSAEPGQPFSLTTLSNDRDAVLSYYLAHGFDHARVEIHQTVEPQNNERVDVTLAVSEGQQVLVDHVLLSGLAHTKTSVVQKQLLVHAGDPLDQAALLQTQRNLYNLALFNEVNAAVQNPTGNALIKNVLVQVTEAKRWDLTYGFGLEAQTGTPAVIPGTHRGGTAAQNGKAGVSPRVSLDVSRISLRGTQQSLTLHTDYGLLERVISLTFSDPQFLNHPNLTAAVTGGYSNVQNITTFASSTDQADFRVTQKVKIADTFIYDFQFRRVSVDPNSLEISPNLIPQLSQPVRVGGPALTYFHDTRDPSPLDANRGQYFSLQEFVSDSDFGSQTNFNRLDTSYSTYYTFGKKKYVFARNTRVGFERTFGANSNVGGGTLGLANCAGNLINTNATCNPIPLPERLYAGGASSHRGFGINDAGPRDLTTGYPVGGSAVVVNSFELRLPPPTLPLVGNSISFVFFHDMGNVFQHPGDMFKSIKYFHQPDESACRNVKTPPVPPGEDPETFYSSLVGTCSFNYYSHAVGLGMRYKTPVGPIRLDFSYNLDPPVYPVFYDYTGRPPYVGQAGHFNFFFSIGQAF
ncbi:MAG TPA: POTRA domain-containing protein [Acidobacteriaceae bacterium]|jgi:outer membrane protein assembly complex protein YaeT|nr:POTRA domain-containing protein [Acidobacteriaceae bacterium]